MVKIKQNKKPKLKEGRTQLKLLRIFRNWRYNLANPATLIMAYIQLNTGDYEMAVVRVKRGCFEWYGGLYLVAPEYLYYNRTIKMWCCDYHENLSLPVKSRHKGNSQVKINLPLDRNLEAKEIKEAFKRANIDVENNLDPKILREFTKATVIQKVFQGQEMEGIFKFLKVMLIISVLLNGLTFLMLLKLSGIV